MMRFATLTLALLAAPAVAFRAPVARRSALAMAASTESASSAATADGPLAGERYVAMNRFSVREGKEAAFEKRWADRKSRLSELQGFRYFHLMKREDMESPPDDYNYMSFTIWETKADFDAWKNGPAFVEAHGGGGLMAFVRMFQSLAVMKGPPKPVFYDGLLPIANPDVERPEVVDGWRDIEADGENLLDSEAYVATNRFTVAPDQAEAFEARWKSRESQLMECEGFQNFNMLRSDGPAADGANYISTTIWKNKECFNKWREGQAFGKGHGQAAGGEKKESDAKGERPPSMFKKPPTPVFFDAKLTLLSDKGY